MSDSPGNAEQAAAAPAVAPLAERVAALEERTKPKEKSAAERFRDWAGLLSLLIALGYSWPIGLWDRFIVSSEERNAAEMASLRGALDQSALLMAETGRALSSISDPSLYDTVGRAYNTRLYLLMAKHGPAFDRRWEEFSTAELIVLGYNYLTINKFDRAAKFFEYARHKADNRLLQAEAIRHLAKTLFMGPSSQEKVKARAQFQTALASLKDGRTPQEIGLRATLRSEWGYLELLQGDWLCGVQQTQIAVAELDQAAPLLNDNGNFKRMLIQRTSMLKEQPGQPKAGCAS